MTILLPLCIAALITIALSPLVRRMVISLGVMDIPDERKVHREAMPLMGGLAIYFGFWITVSLTQPLTGEILAFFIGSALVLIAGIWDDWKNMRPLLKYAFQLAAACVVVFFGGVRITFVTSLFGANPMEIGWLAIPLTILWITGLTNAVNFVDGLDGLAAGISGIAAVTIGIISMMEGFYEIGVLALILGVSAIAFLRVNFHPAKIFMGDTGALFLGFSLSVLSVLGLTKMATTVSIFLPVLVMGVPIFDMSLAIIRRLINKKPFFLPDKDHLHHRLLAMGLSHKKAVLVVYGVCALLGVSAIIISLMPTGQALMAIFLVTLVVLYGADKIGIVGRKVRERQATKDSVVAVERRQ